MGDNQFNTKKARKFLAEHPEITETTLHNLGVVSDVFHQSVQRRAAFNCARQEARLAIEKFERNYPEIVRMAELLSEYDHLKAEFAMFELQSIGPRYHAIVARKGDTNASH